MLKRIMLAGAFLAALGIGGLGITNSASAHGGGYGSCYRGGYGYRGPAVSLGYYGYAPRYYRSYYGPSYYGPYYRGGVGVTVPFGGRHHHRGGVSFSLGF